MEDKIEFYKIELNSIKEKYKSTLNSCLANFMIKKIAYSRTLSS